MLRFGTSRARQLERPSHFSKLPTELIYEIVAHVHINTSGHTALFSRDGDTDVSNGNRDEGVRQATLRALSQTSRMLRNICLPLLWESVVLPYESPNKFRIKVDSYGNQFLLSRFERMMDGLVENPILAAYVRRLDVYIQTRAQECQYAIFKLKACLSVLLGMHTLRLEGMFPHVCSDFPGKSFPQIRTLCIPGKFARYLISSFPNVRAVICQDKTNMWKNGPMGAFHDCRDTLEVIEGFPMDPESAEYLAKTTHNLRIIKFSDWVSPDAIILLKPLTRLHTIEMVATYQHWRHRKPKSSEQLDLWMYAAKEALTGHDGWDGRSHGGKRVKMIYRIINPFQHPTIHETFLDVEVD